MRKSYYVMHKFITLCEKVITLCGNYYIMRKLLRYAASQPTWYSFRSHFVSQ